MLIRAEMYEDESMTDLCISLLCLITEFYVYLMQISVMNSAVHLENQK